MNILIICHYFPPEIGAPQARLSEMASAWKTLGHSVNVLTCFPNHPTGIIPQQYLHDYKTRRFKKECIDGITVYRCWVYATPNKGFLKKILGHLSFMISAVIQGGKYVKGNDIIIVSSPTFFAVMSAWFLSKTKRIPYIFEVRDLWPAIFIELGILKNRLIITILEKIELFLYAQAISVVTVTASFKNNIVNRGIPSSKVTIITNGVDLTRFFPLEKDLDLIKKYGLENKFIILYLGAHGISQALIKIIDAAKLLFDHKDIQFLFVGEGAEKEKIVAYSRQINTTNVLFINGQSKDVIPKFYSIMDIGLVPLRDIPLFNTFIPSKMFEIMAMEKPIVASVRGESEEILQQSGAALIGEPENHTAIANNIRKLYNDQNMRINMGRSGKKFVTRYSREKLARDYLFLINEILEK